MGYDFTTQLAEDATSYERAFRKLYHLVASGNVYVQENPEGSFLLVTSPYYSPDEGYRIIHLESEINRHNEENYNQRLAVHEKDPEKNKKPALAVFNIDGVTIDGTVSLRSADGATVIEVIQAYNHEDYMLYIMEVLNALEVKFKLDGNILETKIDFADSPDLYDAIGQGSNAFEESQIKAKTGLPKSPYLLNLELARVLKKPFVKVTEIDGGHQIIIDKSLVDEKKQNFPARYGHLNGSSPTSPHDQTHGFRTYLINRDSNKSIINGGLQFDKDAVISIAGSEKPNAADWQKYLRLLLGETGATLKPCDKGIQVLANKSSKIARLIASQVEPTLSVS